MEKEQILDWLGHPVTLEYISLIKIQLLALQESERYRSTISFGDKAVSVTSDFVAMQQAHIQGQIESLKEVSNLKEMLINDD